MQTSRDTGRRTRNPLTCNAHSAASF
ncbi:uncharacterized protein ACO6RY_13687 [Pungitius sinensis]